MASKKFPPGTNMALEKREERTGRDLDHDGEKGEPKAHVARVRAAAATHKGKRKEIPSGGLVKSKKASVCAKCKARGMTTCSHV